MVNGLGERLQSLREKRNLSSTYRGTGETLGSVSGQLTGFLTEIIQFSIEHRQ